MDDSEGEVITFRIAGRGGRVDREHQIYLRKRVLELVFLSQFPYKFVNLFFTLRIS